MVYVNVFNLLCTGVSFLGLVTELLGFKTNGRIPHSFYLYSRVLDSCGVIGSPAVKQESVVII